MWRTQPQPHIFAEIPSRWRHFEMDGSRRGDMGNMECETPIRLVLCAAAVSLVGLSVGTSSISIQAQSAGEAEVIGFHQMCNKGDRKASIRFGIMIGENRERHTEWRRTHPEFWWWER
jgi:hypothetical protein